MKKLSWLITIAALLVGAAGVYQHLALGAKAAGYSSAVPWGLGVATYMLASGLSAGVYLLSNLPVIFGIKELEPARRPGLLLALAAIGLDLGHLGRAWEVFFTPNFHSPMAWMVWLYGIYLVILIGQLYYEARGKAAPGTAPGGSPGVRQPSRSLAMVGVLVAAAFSGGLGALLGVVQARPYWSNPLLPVMFLVAALASGSALLTFVVAVANSGRQEAETGRAINILAKIVLGLLVFYLLFELAEMLLGSYYLSPAHALPYQQILLGPNWWIFWGVHLVVGALLPVLLLVRGQVTTRSAGWAGLLITIGFLGVRYNIVVPGLLVPLFPELPAAYSEPGLAYTYVPTWSEWLAVLFVLALGILIFKLGMEYLPFNRHPDQQEVITNRYQEVGTSLPQ
ncbi:NrfD/PsrC family molybdoenzyme membrane anchor subunit [Moorella sp. Hama-1]|uniref:NrfD/PsrC family molybdoenzyme membrane anchor subunit n=1 Tax=Moorella sp. Hama-1 TaxID=2138101 RepID=UPI00137B8AB4|nr:NrfD/PsrC family molybdoenzyme membrane anchor subunit [Moorella sp. Hama-1]BCV22795.1 polysulfide reductase [Moorella sp. Hama-1]